MSRRDDLLRSPLFKDLPLDAIAMVERAVTERRFEAGETVLSQEAQGEALHIITSGVVRVSRVSVGGRERVLGYLYAPAVVGEIAVLVTSERVATVVALEPVRTLMLYREHFVQVMRRYPEVLWNLARILAERVTHINDELIALGVNTEAALSYALLTLYRQRVAAGVKQPAFLPLTQGDLMARLSSSRETISRVLRKLEEERLVKVVTLSNRSKSDDEEAVRSTGIQLLDEEGLEALVFGLDRTQ